MQQLETHASRTARERAFKNSTTSKQTPSKHTRASESPAREEGAQAFKLETLIVGSQGPPQPLLEIVDILREHPKQRHTEQADRQKRTRVLSTSVAGSATSSSSASIMAATRAFEAHPS